jgi:hypothetical protein
MKVRGTYFRRSILLDGTLDLPDGHRVVLHVEPIETKPERGIEEGESVWAWIAQFKKDGAPQRPEPRARPDPTKHVDHCIYGMPVGQSEAAMLCSDVA